jgi:hypothetical protein
LHDPVTFDLEVYQGLTIAEQLECVRRAIRSIRSTLSPASSDIEKIDIEYLKALRKEISEYFELFNAVVDSFPKLQLAERDIIFLETQCKDVSSVRTELRRVLALLSTARKMLATIEKDIKNKGSFGYHFSYDYEQCLQTDCYDALTAVLESIQKGN